MKKTFTFWKSLFLLCALIVGSTSVWATDVTMAYSGSTTNMTNGNNASSVGLSADDWDVTAVQTGATTNALYPGLNKAGNIRLYYNETTSNSITVASKNNATINSITVNYGSETKKGVTTHYNGGVVTASGSTISDSNSDADVGEYAINSSSFTISNGNSTNVQVWIQSIVITYTASGDVTNSSEVAFENGTPSMNIPATNTYSQIATTATGYTGTVTYEITANTAGATIEGSTVTVTHEGSVTVKATAPAITGWTKSEASYTLTVNDTRANNELAYATASQEVNTGAVLIAPALTNPHSLPITYSSADETIATVDAEGNVTGVKVGTTTIYATTIGDATYKASTVSYTLEVKFAITDGVFDFVNAGNSNPLVDYGSGMVISDSYTTTNKKWTAGNVTMVTKKVSGNGYRWYSSDKTLRFYNESTATFSVSDDYVITKIVTAGANFNSADKGTLSGSTWTGCSNKVTLHATATKNIETITVTYTTPNQTFTPAKTYTTLTSAYALDFTNVSGLKAFIATTVSDSKVQMTPVNKVPAGTGLVLKATTPNSAVNVPVFDGASPDDVSGNLMVGSATETTAIEKDGGYILKDGVFQPASAGTLAAGKAYLNIAVPTNNNARPLEMSFDDATTAINGIEEVAPVNVKTRKVVKNGRLVIETANGEFTIDGARMK